MVSFMHNGSEILDEVKPRWGITQNQKHKIQNNGFKINIFFEFQAADRYISTSILELYAKLLK